MSRDHSAVSLWVRRLSFSAAPACIWTLLYYGRFQLWCTSSTRSGRAVAWLLWKSGWLAKPYQEVPFTAHGQRVDHPVTGHLKIHAGVNAFTEEFSQKYRGLISSLGVRDSAITLEHVTANLRKAFALQSYELLLFIEFARYQHRLAGAAQTSRIIVATPGTALTSFASLEWPDSDVVLRQMPSLRNWTTLRLARGIFRTIAAALRPGGVSRDRLPSIGIAAVWGLNLSARLNDLFWWWKSEIPATRLVLFFDRPDQPASRAIVKTAEELGIECTVLNKSAVGDSPHLFWQPSINGHACLKRIGQLFKVFLWGFTRGKSGQWMACRVMGLVNDAHEGEEFLKCFNIRALLHHNDSEVDHWSVACEMAGAARIGYHWSNHHWPVAYHARLHQVFFAWGMHHVGILDASGGSVPNVLLSGCVIPGVYDRAEPRKEVQKARSALTGQGATRILTLFDTSMPCERFYAFFLERVASDPRWGMMIKPKGPNSLRWAQEGRELRDLFQKALATGRVQVLDWSVMPVEAAAAADFAVGVDINSATVLAALAGHRAIHLDYVRLHESELDEWACFYRLGPDRLVFEDPDKLWTQLNLYFDAPEEQPTLGLVDDVLLKDIDPFRDGKADIRIGEYLQWYLEGLDKGLGRDAALHFSNSKYRERWGARAIVRSCRTDSGPSFSSESGMPLPRSAGYEFARHS